MKLPDDRAALLKSALHSTFRALYWAFWFFILPLVLAGLVVEALTPEDDRMMATGLLGSLQWIVQEQPLPVAIVAVAIFDFFIWSLRHHLPLARFAFEPYAIDARPSLRASFEQARALLDEADRISKKYASSIERDMPPAGREELKASLDDLRAAMARVPFEEPSFTDALIRANGEVGVRLSQWRTSETREYTESILIALGVAFLLRAFVVEAFKIPSGSMIPTLQVGDHIFVNKFVYGPTVPMTKVRFFPRMPPHRGEVMVFEFPENPAEDFIKRVITLPGDRLDMKNGHPWINGWEVPHCSVGEYTYRDADPKRRGETRAGDLFVEYLEDEMYLTLYLRTDDPPPRREGPFYAKNGQVWVLGDNRNASKDSRKWWDGKGGGVPFENIRGRAMFVWWSKTAPKVDRNGHSAMSVWWQKFVEGTDWSRFGTPVMGHPRLPEAMKSLEPAMEACFNARPPRDKTTPPPPKPTVEVDEP